MIPGSANPLLLKSAAAAGGYQVSRSLRFNSSDSGFCSRTPAVAGSRTTWTWAAWVKRTVKNTATDQMLFTGGTTNSDTGFLALDFNSSDKLRLSSAATNFLITTAVYRDPGAWMHIVLAFDATQGTNANKVKLYVNSTEVTVFDTDGRSSISNQDYGVNQAAAHEIGRASLGSNKYLDGYLADIHFIDGQALTPSSFTEVSATTGQLIPKAYTGTFGTNGFWLKFSDNSALTSGSNVGVGKDYSGNANYFNTSGLSVTETSPALFNAPLSSTPFTDGSNSAVSITNNGSITASSAGTNSLNISNAANFPGGSTSGLTIGSSLNRTGLYTLDIYFKCTLAQQSRFFTNDGTNVGQGLAIATNGSITCYDFGNAVLASAGAVSANTWYHFRLIANNTAILASYLNGAVQTTSGSLSNFAANTALRIGWGETDTAHSFAGQLGPVRFTAANLGKPPSGGLLTTSGTITNNPYAVNIAPGNDSLVDTPTSYGTDTYVGGEVRGNYCTLNPLDNGSVTLSNGNLDGSATVAWKSVRGTVAFPLSGKWYYEVTPGGSALLGVGIAAANKNLTDQSTGTFVTYNEDGRFYKDGSINASGKATYTSGDVIGVAFNCDTNSVTFYKNNVSQGSVTPTTGASYFPFVQIYNSSYSANFGQRAFAYTAPSGFKALCDTNLPAPLVAKPSTVMDVKLYTGNGSTQTISGLNFSPDLVWIKNRAAVSAHRLLDTIRGATKDLYSNQTDSEQTDANSLTAFTSNGFSVGSSGGVNGNGNGIVAWAWNAGGTTDPSNTAGSITSQVRANVSAGFSVVTYTGNATAGATVGHGLGVAPEFLISKSRSDTGGWLVYHKSIGNTKYLALNSTIAEQTSSDAWNNTTPSSTVFTLGGSGAQPSGVTRVAYCFAPVVGYSNGFSYTGNGSADGPYIHLGFRTRFLILKRTDASGDDWLMVDTARNPYNLSRTYLYANLSSAEMVYNLFDITANGIKLRDNYQGWNASGGTYVGFAWAEAPFAYSRAR